MATEFNTGSDSSLNEAVKSRYEANANTNAFTDAEKSKLATLPAGAEANTVDSVNGETGAVSLDADDISDDATVHKFASAAQLSKIDGIEAGATADQTGAEIVSAIDTELGGTTWQSGGGGGSTDVVSNVAQDRILGRTATGSGDSEELTATDVRTFLNVEDGATADQTGAEIVSAIDTELGGTTWQSGGGGGSTDVVSNVAQGRILGRTAAGSGDSEELTASDVRAFLNIEDGASADQNGAEIKALYEGEADTNAFTDAEKSKLASTLAASVLASTSSAEGASLIGIEDSGAYTSETNVEGALQEIYGTLASQGVASVNTQTGAAYTLVLADKGVDLDMDNAAANTVTIPDNATEAFDTATEIFISQIGAGATTITAAAGVTLNGAVAGSITLGGQFSGVVLRKLSADAWFARGDFS